MKPVRIMGLWVDFHWSILILIFIISTNLFPFLSNTHPTSGMLPLLLSCTLICASFVASILVHELSHVWMGRKFGIQFSGITLFLFGGAARITTQPRTPEAEFLTAIAGPICSILIAASFAISTAMFVAFGIGTENLFVHTLVIVATVNTMLGVFNMVPAFPLDGGRVVRAIIWKRTKNFAKATLYASYGGILLGGFFITTGVFMAFGLKTPFGIGIGDGLWIGVIGFLIISMARRERKAVCG